jgi:hypothetical protein
VKFHSLLRALATGAFAFITASILAGCGGGGAATGPAQPGSALLILPSTGSIYAGVPHTFTISGGRAPYTVSSSEPSLLPVPATVNGTSFTVVANNPGVVDPSTDPLVIPSRTVTIQVRDAFTGSTVSGTYNVLQNFLTGYGVSFTPIACSGITPTPSAGNTGTAVPAGCEVAVQFNATTSGNLGADRQFRLEAIRGPFIFVDAVTGVTGNSIVVTSDHRGRVNAIIRTLAGSPTQVAVIRITELTTRVFTDTLFTITGAGAGATLVVIPASVTFTGPNNQTCGTGDADVYVFDGTPPYSATSTNPNIVVVPMDPNSNPGVFRIRAVNPNVCLTASVIITDRFGARTTVTVVTAAGANAPPAPPPPPVTTSPATMTLGCGQSGSVSVTGGVPPYSTSSPTPGVTAAVVGSTLTVTRAAVGSTGAATPSTTAPVNVTDGATIATVAVTVPTTCP